VLKDGETVDQVQTPQQHLHPLNFACDVVPSRFHWLIYVCRASSSTSLVRFPSLLFDRNDRSAPWNEPLRTAGVRCGGGRRGEHSDGVARHGGGIETAQVAHCLNRIATTGLSTLTLPCFFAAGVRVTVTAMRMPRKGASADGRSRQRRRAQVCALADCARGTIYAVC
jgi:hypothetical protein